MARFAESIASINRCNMQFCFSNSTAPASSPRTSSWMIGWTSWKAPAVSVLNKARDQLYAAIIRSLIRNIDLQLLLDAYHVTIFCRTQNIHRHDCDERISESSSTQISLIQKQEKKRMLKNLLLCLPRVCSVCNIIIHLYQHAEFEDVAKERISDSRITILATFSKASASLSTGSTWHPMLCILIYVHERESSDNTATSKEFAAGALHEFDVLVSLLASRQNGQPSLVMSLKIKRFGQILEWVTIFNMIDALPFKSRRKWSVRYMWECTA